VYVAGSTPANGTTYHSVMWAGPDSRYVMLIQATSEEQRQVLVRAFPAAAASLGCEPLTRPARHDGRPAATLVGLGRVS
jgi:hypothetical protein